MQLFTSVSCEELNAEYNNINMFGATWRLERVEQMSCKMQFLQTLTLWQLFRTLFCYHYDGTTYKICKRISGRLWHRELWKNSHSSIRFSRPHCCVSHFEEDTLVAFDILLILTSYWFWHPTDFDILLILTSYWFWHPTDFDILQILTSYWFWHPTDFDILLILTSYWFWHPTDFDILQILTSYRFWHPTDFDILLILTSYWFWHPTDFDILLILAEIHTL